MTDANRKTAEDVISRYFNVIGDADAAELVALFATDCSMEDPVGTPVLRGHDGVRVFHKGLHKAWKSLSMTVNDMHVRGDAAAAGWAAEGVSAAGNAISFTGIDVFHLDDDVRIERLEGYWDLEAVIARM